MIHTQLQFTVKSFFFMNGSKQKKMLALQMHELFYDINIKNIGFILNYYCKSLHYFTYC